MLYSNVASVGLFAHKTAVGPVESSALRHSQVHASKVCSMFVSTCGIPNLVISVTHQVWVEGHSMHSDAMSGRLGKGAWGKGKLDDLAARRVMDSVNLKVEDGKLWAPSPYHGA